MCESCIGKTVWAFLFEMERACQQVGVLDDMVFDDMGLMIWCLMIDD